MSDIRHHIHMRSAKKRIKNKCRPKKIKTTKSPRLGPRFMSSADKNFRCRKYLYICRIHFIIALLDESDSWKYFLGIEIYLWLFLRFFKIILVFIAHPKIFVSFNWVHFYQISHHIRQIYNLNLIKNSIHKKYNMKQAWAGHSWYSNKTLRTENSPHKLRPQLLLFNMNHFLNWFSSGFNNKKEKKNFRPQNLVKENI